MNTDRKPYRSTLDVAPYYISRRLPFVADDGKLFGTLVSGTFYVVSLGRTIATDEGGYLHLVPGGDERKATSTRRHVHIVQRSLEQTV